MYEIILDFNKKKIMVPKEVTNAIGATEDFGILFATDRPQIVITRKNPLAVMMKRPAGKAGRPQKHRSNMQRWNEDEEAFYFPMIENPFLKFGSRECLRYAIAGEMANEGTLIYELPTHLAEQDIFSGYEVVPRELFSIKNDKELIRELREQEKRRRNRNADS